MTLLEDYGRKEIDIAYEHLLAKLKDGTLYGITMDVTDMKMMVVAAFLYGESGARQQHMKDLDTLAGLR